MMSKNSIVPFLKDYLIKFLTRPFLLDTNVIYITMIHIGQLIESELHRQERSVSWFAQKLCCERTNVYSIFKRKSIDTALLIRICQILHYDFFAVYSLKLEIKDQVATNPVQ